MTIDLPELLQRVTARMSEDYAEKLPPRLWPICASDVPLKSTVGRLEGELARWDCLTVLEWYELYLEVERHGTTIQTLLRAPAAISQILDRASSQL